MNKESILVILSLVLLFSELNSRSLQNTASEPTPTLYDQAGEESTPPQNAYKPEVTETNPEVYVSITNCEDMKNIKLACIQTPVCGYLVRNCKEKECKIQFNSTCEACTYAGVLEYELKSCEDDSNQFVDPIPSIMPIAMEYLKCSEEERNTPCFDTPTNTKVCAVNNQCINDTTQCKTFDNVCTVCKDRATIYYFLSECGIQYNPLPIIDKPEDTFYFRAFCDDGYRDIDCTDMPSDAPQVCGFIKDCDPTKEQCFVTKNNKCEVCKDKNITEFTDKPCPEALKCKDKSFMDKNCEKYKLVCGYKSNCKEEEGEPCYYDYPQCDVCSNTEVESYFNNDCKSLSVLYSAYEKNAFMYATYACSDLGKKGCDQESNKGDFCAYKNMEKCTTDCTKTFDNLCDACNDKEYEWVENIRCFSEGDVVIDYLYDNEIPSPPEIAYTTTTNANDVKTQETNKATNTAGALNNSILPEASIDANVSMSSTSMQAKRCNSSSGNICPEIYSPVCAYKKCASGLCPVEKANSCFACVDNTVEYYVEEACNNAISKRVDVTCMEKEKVAQCTENSIMMRNVCGTSSCEDGICHKNYASVCDACSEVNVNQYYEGECFVKFFSVSLILLVLINLVLI